MSYKKQQGLILRDAYIMWGYSILESNNPKKSMGYRSQMNTMYLSKSMRRKAPEMRATINKKMKIETILRLFASVMEWESKWQ